MIVTRFDIVALAKRINQLRIEYNDSHEQRVRITPAMSRILENDPDYVPYRCRKGSRCKGAAQAPSIVTLIEIADILNTTVADLIGEPAPSPFGTQTEREKVKAFLRAVANRV